MRLFMTWLSAILLCVTTSCVSVPQEHNSQNTTRSYIEVDNENWADVVVYVTVSGAKQRLGDVTSYSTRRLVFTRQMENVQLQFLVHPIGGAQDWVSDALEINTPSRIKLTVQQPMTYSHFEYFPIN